ncbi:MAG TPA: PqiC family protein [Acetobacteraceae bacterium]|nr:PqiC family protein [Acetobacteraceae bacterium]
MVHRHVFAVLTFFLSLVLLAACSSAPTVVYTLNPVPPAPSRAAAGPPLDPPIELGQVMIPGVIDRDSVVIAAPGGQLDVNGTAVWGGPLGEMIRRTLSANLAARLAPGSVLAPGDPAPPGGVRVLLVNVQRFWGDTQGQVGLVADWSLAKQDGSALGEPHRVVVSVKAASGDVSAVVPTMSRALGLLADRIAAALR